MPDQDSLVPAPHCPNCCHVLLLHYLQTGFLDGLCPSTEGLAFQQSSGLASMHCQGLALACFVDPSSNLPCPQSLILFILYPWLDHFPPRPVVIQPPSPGLSTNITVHKCPGWCHLWPVFYAPSAKWCTLLSLEPS